MTSLFFPSISPEAGEPNNEVIPSKEFKYQLKSQILSVIKNKREICYTQALTLKDPTIYYNYCKFGIVLPTYIPLVAKTFLSDY